jgi:rare lipoprotein A
MIMTRIRAPFVLAICAAFLLSACAETQLVIHGAKELTGSANSSKVAKTKGRYKVGNPYQIKETWYYPAENFKYAETGIASWYGPQFHGKRTANGETFDMNSLTAAHRTLPMPSAVRVVNLTNGRSIILRVNDRGPFARSRIIDLSRRAAQLLGFQRQGTARVRVEIVADESRQLNGKLTQSERITGQAVAKQSVQSRPLAGNRTASVERFDGDAGRDVLRRSPVTDNRPVVKTVAPTVESKLFVQAGAYADFANASRVRTRLSRFGPAWVTKAQVGRPLQTVENADAVLAQLMTSGFPKARIVLD